MHGRRRRARELALQILFQVDVASGELAPVFVQFWSDREEPEEVRDFAERIVRGVRDRRRELDAWIAAAAHRWRIERMAVVDRNVLRISAWEMLAERDTPPVVAIDEAVELAKRFGSGESGQFVNGVLDAIRKRLDAGELHPPVPRQEPS